MLGAMKQSLSLPTKFSTVNGLRYNTGGNTLVTYLSSGSITVTQPITLDVYICGGGAGGWYSSNAAIAAGGDSALTSTSLTQTLGPGTYTVTVGAGGAPSGSDSTIKYSGNAVSIYTGSGVVSTSNSNAPGAGAGGSGSGVNGGPGIVSPITEYSTYPNAGYVVGYPQSGTVYINAGGGAAQSVPTYAGSGGNYGGGQGGFSITSPSNGRDSTDGYVNSGSGGGGMYQQPGAPAYIGPAAGGSGFVVLRVRN